MQIQHIISPLIHQVGLNYSLCYIYAKFLSRQGDSLSTVKWFLQTHTFLHYFIFRKHGNILYLMHVSCYSYKCALITSVSRLSLIALSVSFKLSEGTGKTERETHSATK